MKLIKTQIAGAFLVELELLEDERGFFARIWCADEFRTLGLNPRFAQCSVSFNRRRGTLRGLHFQAPPHEEAKLVRCTRGAIFDVIADVRSGSPTFGRWVAAELTAHNHLALYVPEGVAHGFQTLEDNSEVLYQISEPHCPESARGVRWDDGTLAIRWPETERIISPRDLALPFLRDLGSLHTRPERTAGDP